MSLTSEIITIRCGGSGPDLPSPLPGSGPRPFITVFDNTSNSRTPCECMQDAYLNSLSLPGRIPEILIYIHDDVAVYDPLWLDKVLDVFVQNPNCAVVGLGGATELGREGLYKRPYRITDMARGNYASAQRDWATHGSHLDGVRRVAVLDAFFLAVRTEFLTEAGGCPVDHCSHHCVDLWLACEAARRGRETYAIGIDCHHFGGGTSTKPAYREAKWLQGGNMVGDHERPHRWLWKEYGDVLPIRTGR